MTNEDKKHRVYIIRENNRQKFGITDSISHTKALYGIAPWPIGFIHSKLSIIEYRICQILYKVSSLITRAGNYMFRIASSLHGISERGTPTRIKFMSDPMDRSTAIKLEQNMNEKIKRWEKTVDEYDKEFMSLSKKDRNMLFRVA